MKLPTDTYGELDMDAMEHLLTVHEFLTLMYLASKPDQELIVNGRPDHLNELRCLKRLSDWGLMRLHPHPEPDLPLRHLRKLTLLGRQIAWRYSSETLRLILASNPPQNPPAA